MPDSEPIAAPDIPERTVELLDTLDTKAIRAISEYVEALAEYREREARLSEKESNDEETKDQVADLPDDVPAKATITIKEINKSRYYYWQWREGEKIKSKYKGPVAKTK